ncbi:MAG: HAMP domain-containing histidine kinase [Candidatus Firestonebacteria bacterium]|nr:HAMP domain-containing histidine kinase [Candidatus Firestonebacteria bacterium]
MFNIKSLFNKTKECWEYRKCKNELRDKCPAFQQKMTRECWLVDGTLCEGLSHDEFSRKLNDCTNCDYYILSAWGLEPTETHKKFVKESVHKAREKKARISIESILRDCVFRFKNAASVKKIKLELSIPDKLKESSGNSGFFYGNKEELSHVLLHFVSKSLTFSKPETTLYLRADDIDTYFQIGIIYSSLIGGPLLYEEKTTSKTIKEKREILSETIIENHGGRCWEEINPVGRSGLFFTLSKDRRAAKQKELAKAKDVKDRRI